MSLSVNAAFDSGNIEVHRIDHPHNIVLSIRRDNNSRFFQWFYFRLTGLEGREATVRIVELQESAYPDGWPGYSACISEDRVNWRRAPTAYNDGTLSVRLHPKGDSVWIAYFVPYSMERHHNLIAATAQKPGVTTHVLGETLDGQAIDLIEMGSGPRQVWLIARQHPGETMGEWWIEGALERLCDPDDAVTQKLLEQAHFYIVPNMNPDGTKRGHLRTNAAGVNLNREWHAPSLNRSPEVYHVFQRMRETGVDFCLDVHGDEAIPHNFIAGFEGIPSLDPRQLALLNDYRNRLARLNPDFQTAVGYPEDLPGKANMTLSVNAIAEHFGCLAMILEMPFKDSIDNPEPIHGWSPKRSKTLAWDCLAVLADMTEHLR